MHKKQLIKSLKRIVSRDIGYLSEPGLLAFLGLTSKSEAHYRDTIAFLLFKEFKNEFIVTREWKRCDIAVLNKNTREPVLLLELKVCYHVDLYKESSLEKYVARIKKDLTKSKKIAVDDTDIYSILFIVKPKDIVPNELSNIVKYVSLINAGLRKHDYYTLNAIGENNMRDKFRNIEFFSIKKEDHAFGLACDLACCLIKA